MPWQALDIGAGLLGLASARSSDRKNRLQRELEFDEQKRQFNILTNESIYRRVKDARRAGVHPLFALGGNPSGSPTITGGAPTGGATSQAIQGLGSALARAQVRAVNAEATKSEAEAQLADSKTATISQRLAASGRDGAQITEYPSGGKVVTYPMPENEWMDGPVYGPAEFYNPEVPTSQGPGLRAGNIPEKVNMTTRDGRNIEIANPDLFDEIGQVEYVVKKARLAVTDRIEYIANWLKSRRAPSDREVAQLERRLQAIKDNPQKAAEANALYQRLIRRLKSLRR